MHSDAKALREMGSKLFQDKMPLDLRNQEIARHFYPQRATFTTQADIGEDWAGHLMTGYPALVQRDLGNALGSILRPRGQSWFHGRAGRDGDEASHDTKAWLEFATKLQRNAMYDTKANFARATKEGDMDFSAFGGCAISIDVNRKGPNLVYRCWHLRDCAWSEDTYGQINAVHRNWKPSCAELIQAFGREALHPNVVKMYDEGKKANTVGMRHVVISADEYDWKKSRHPWVSLYLDVDNAHVVEEVGSWTRRYVLPRWSTISGSAYGISPAAVVALPDARLIQAMTLTLLDAGERAANPPLIGVSEAVRGDLNIFPGGFTAVDAEYDERLGEVLRPLTTDKNGIPFGFEMVDRQAEMLREAFYLNTLSMPPSGGPEMTAFEVGQRVQEYIRKALPLFEPMEADYNGALCEMTFETLFRDGAFGSMDNIPDELRGEDVKFSFESPLSEMIERQKGQMFLESKAMVAQAMEMDPSAGLIIDFGATLRDVLDGIGAPKKWLRSPEEVEAAVAAAAEAEQAQSMMAEMQGGAQVADTLGSAAQKFGSLQGGAGAVPGPVV